MSPPIYPRRPSARPLPSLQSRRSIYDMSSASDEAITTLLVANLHCSSCVKTIQDALGSLSTSPTAVDVSIVTQTVTVHHLITLSPSEIKTTLDEVGFDIVDTPTADHHPPPLPTSISRLPPHIARKRLKHIQQCPQCQQEHSHATAADDGRDKLGEDTLVPQPHVAESSDKEKLETSLEGRTDISSASTPVFPAVALPSGPLHVTLSVGGMTCASCSNTLTEILTGLPGVSEVSVHLLSSAANVSVDKEERVQEVIGAIEGAGYDAEIVSVNAAPSPGHGSEVSRTSPEGPYQLTLSVGGMTCVSCTNTVTSLTSAIPGVSEVVVNLIGKSATAILTHKELAEQVVQVIEDAGFEAEVVELQSIHGDQVQRVGPRTITLQVEGMFCPHCPQKVMDMFAPLGVRVVIEKPLRSHTDPLLTLSYTPSPPDFTIRTILDTINTATNALSRPFTATIYHPPSLEDRARRMRAREQRALLWRLAFSFIVAIPTFIIGIVYMSLVPSSNMTRMWWMRPLWAGNASRVEWAMFLLATPVMFYSAGIFHQRSLKEIWSLWRRSSRVPVWKRFVRFGSMNLLVSTGVSVAYFASVALLALAASAEPSPTGEGDSTTYFDSVVLLTMFLLAGRFLEAYSKAHTADAITALGKLRPAVALLLASPKSAGQAVSPKVSYSLSSDPEKGSEDGINGSVMEATFPTSFTRIPVDQLEIGDVVRVQHGATPPADGTLVNVEGECALFDESSLTGESRPVGKKTGDNVFVGTINKGVVVDVKVEAIGGETMLDHVVKVVREGQTRRAPIERVADLLTGYFVPVVTALAIITWIVWLALGLSGALPRDYLDRPVGGWIVWSLEFAIAVFVVACPCGIGLAAPTALLVGSGLAAKYGILVRGGGEAFQEAAQLDLVVFDKTGTLTEGGDPRVVDADLALTERAGWLPAAVLGVASELESASSHPLATAIRTYCAENNASPQLGAAFAETAGRGVKADFRLLDCEAIIGNEAWLEEHDTVIDGALESRLASWKAEGFSVVLLALRRHAEGSVFQPCAAFAVADPLRPEAAAVVSHLQEQGIRTWMISGDNPITACAVARRVGIPETNVIAGVLPHEKAQRIQWLQQVGMKRALPAWRRWVAPKRLNARCVVAMVGDGINDAPALSAADVGIAIGSGSDVAISSASFILVSSHLQSLLTLLDLSRRVFNRVKFNFLWASIYNLVALPIAAGVVYPAANHPRLDPVWASLAMALSSVSVVCSSLLLKLYKEPKL